MVAQSALELASSLNSIKLPKGVKLADYIGSSLAGARGDGPFPDVGQIADATEPLHRLLLAATAGAAQLQVNAFFKLLQQNRSMSFAVFLSRIGLGTEEASSGASEYVEDLQSSIASPDAFGAVIQRLKNDKSLTSDDLSTIASAFTGLKKKWTRKSAIDALLSKHSAYLQAVSSFGDANGKSAA